MWGELEVGPHARQHVLTWTWTGAQLDTSTLSQNLPVRQPLNEISFSKAPFYLSSSNFKAKHISSFLPSCFEFLFTNSNKYLFLNCSLQKANVIITEIKHSIVLVSITHFKASLYNLISDNQTGFCSSLFRNNFHDFSFWILIFFLSSIAWDNTCT